jgi:hypothetical protein
VQQSRARGPFSQNAAGLALGLLGALGAALAAGISGASAAEAPAGPGTRASEARPNTQRLVLAHYYYSYQGDPRKAAPFREIRNAQGLTTLTDHPWESVGPWMSYDRAQWHKNQFQMMAAGGIDVALAIYRGDLASRRAYAIKGLDVMTQGLKELRSEGLAPFTRPREYPQIGLALDLGGLADQYGGPVDLKLPDVQRSLYGMVREFYLHVPEEFRATVQLPASRLSPGDTIGAASTSQGVAYIVRLINEAAVKDVDNGFITYANRRFAQEFGARLLWVGTPGLRARVTGLDAVSPFPAATQPATILGTGWVRTGSFGPGYDNSLHDPAARIRPRENGQQTVLDFRKIIDSDPEWVFIDSWNGYTQGTDIAPTLQHGLLYRDLLRAAVLQYKQAADYAAHFVKATVPRVMQPGSVYQVEVAVQNSGTSDWDVFNIASLTYRWLKNGEPVGEQGIQISSTGQVRGDTRSYLIGVTSPIKEGKTLPAGQYELEFNMTRRVGSDTVWFDQERTAPYRVPVTVGPAPASRPYWISSTMSALTRRGATYPAQIRLRNDGSETWKKGVTSVGYRWRRVSTYLKGAADDKDLPAVEGGRVAVDADVPPGRMITVEVPVTTGDAQGRPLQTWSPQEDWVYVLEWDIHDGQKYLGQAGGATYREPVEVLDRDPAPCFIGCSLPSDLVAGRTEKITVGLRNCGPDTWKKDRDKVVVHWYYMDGTEASWNDDALLLQEDVPPFSRSQMTVPIETLIKAYGLEDPKGKKKKEREKKEKPDPGAAQTTMVVCDTILREVPVRVPYYFGPMYCVLDFQHDGMIASTGPGSKGNDILVIPVNVFSPTFTPLPVYAYYNTDGISQDVSRADGNIDGRGNSLPAEFLPPYVARPSVGISPAISPLYPSGLWSRPLNDLEGSRVCFLYPSKNNNTPNMIQCGGQQIAFGGLQRTAVHLLAVCTEEDVSGEFTLYYSDGTTEKKKLTFTHWNFPPKNGEKVAFTTPHRHTARADDASTRCYINHYTIPTNRLKQLAGIELPRLPALKIMAITLESATLRAN